MCTSRARRTRARRCICTFPAAARTRSACASTARRAPICCHAATRRSWSSRTTRKCAPRQWRCSPDWATDCYEAGNAHQALEQFVHHPEIALVFSDIMLPGGMLGSQLVQRNCASGGPELKVLMTSGFSESGMHAPGHSRRLGRVAGETLQAGGPGASSPRQAGWKRGEQACSGVKGTCCWRSMTKSISWS